MAEEAYPKDHPAHPDNAGKKYAEPRTAFNSDYPANAAARGGQGQAVATVGGGFEPRDGHKHLDGLPGATLIEKQREFARLPGAEQEARLEWNEKGIPAKAEEE